MPSKVAHYNDKKGQSPKGKVQQNPQIRAPPPLGKRGWERGRAGAGDSVAGGIKRPNLSLVIGHLSFVIGFCDCPFPARLGLAGLEAREIKEPGVSLLKLWEEFIGQTKTMTSEN